MLNGGEGKIGIANEVGRSWAHMQREQQPSGNDDVNDVIISSRRVNLLLEVGYIIGCKEIFISHSTTWRAARYQSRVDVTTNQFHVHKKNLVNE